MPGPQRQLTQLDCEILRHLADQSADAIDLLQMRQHEVERLLVERARVRDLQVQVALQLFLVDPPQQGHRRRDPIRRRRRLRQRVEFQQPQLHEAQLRPVAGRMPLRQRPVECRRPNIIRLLEMHLIKPRLHVGRGVRHFVVTLCQLRKSRLRVVQPVLRHRLVIHRHHRRRQRLLPRRRARDPAESGVGVARQLVCHELPRLGRAIRHRRRRSGERQQHTTQTGAEPAAPLG